MLETAAGAAGALVSTASDLATFVRALAHGELLSGSIDPPSATGISNARAIPGLTTHLQYDRATGDLFVLLLDDDSRSPELLGTVLAAIVRARQRGVPPKLDGASRGGGEAVEEPRKGGLLLAGP